MSTEDYRNRYIKETDHNGIIMTRIGHRTDHEGYYRGSDGNAWSWSCRTGWTNRGPVAPFIEQVEAGKVLGVIH